MVDSDLTRSIRGTVAEFVEQNDGPVEPEAVVDYLTETDIVAADAETIESQISALVQRGDLERVEDKLEVATDA